MTTVKVWRFSLALALSGSLAGCASTVSTEPYQTYRVGQTVTANVGMAFLDAQRGTKTRIKQWVGIVQSPDGWVERDVYSADYLSQQLIYSGRSGNTVDIEYREFRGNLAAPAFYQKVQYDLGQSDLIQFQRFRFQVLGADNSAMTVKILSDGTGAAASPPLASGQPAPQAQVSTSAPTASPVGGQQARSQYTAEQFARSQGCSTGIRLLMADHPREVYQASCPDGRGLTITCEWGSCRGQ